MKARIEETEEEEGGQIGPLTAYRALRKRNKLETTVTELGEREGRHQRILNYILTCNRTG